MGNAKMTRKVKFHPAAHLIKNHQNRYNSCCFSSLTPAFHCIGDNGAVPALMNCIEESLTLQKNNLRIEFISLMILLKAEEG